MLIRPLELLATDKNDLQSKTKSISTQYLLQKLQIGYNYNTYAADY